MKGLFISGDKDQWVVITRLFYGHFRSIKIICAKDIKEAEDKISQALYDLLIFDMNDKNLNLAEGFTDCFISNNSRPVVLIGTKAIISTNTPDNFFELNEANGILYTPIEMSEFKKIIVAAVQWINQKNFGKSLIDVVKSDYTPMKIKNFYRFNKLQHDAFREYSNTQFIKVIIKDKIFSQGDIQKLIKERVHYLWLKNEDHLNFLNRSMINLIKIFDSNTLGPEHIFQIEIKACNIIAEHIKTIGINDGLILLIEKTLESIQRNFEQLGNLKSVLGLFPFLQRDLGERSVLTAYICEGMAVKLQWSSDVSRRKLVFCSLIYDCLLKNDELLKVSGLEDPLLQEFEDEEIQSYKEHPIKAAEVASLFTKYPDVDFLIREHEEKPHGRGFPSKLRGGTLTPLSCAFITAINFVNELSMVQIKSESIISILYNMEEDFQDGNFRQAIKALSGAIRRVS